MSGNSQHNWCEANQRYLQASLARVRQAVAASGVAVDGEQARSLVQVPVRNGNDQGSLDPRPFGSGLPVINEAVGEAVWTPALERLCAVFSLSSFERDVLLLCAGVEMDMGFRRLCADAQDDPQYPFPTFSLAFAALAEPYWNAILPGAPLRYWKLLKVEAGETLSLSPLRIEERVLHYLMGLSYLDEDLQDLVQPLAAGYPLPQSHHSLSEQIAELWKCSASESGADWPVIQLYGDEHATQLAIAAAASAEVGASPYLMQLSDIPASIIERQSLARLWGREAALNDCVLLVDYERVDELNQAGRVLSFAEGLRGRVLLIGREPLALPGHKRVVIRFEVNKLNTAEQFTLWEGNLGSVAHKLNGQLESLVSRFSLGAPAIRAACAEALATRLEDPDQIGEVLWQACRRQARPRLDDLAQRIQPAAAWDDLVLPEVQHQTLHDIVNHVRQRVKVYETWRFGTKGSRGLGISALFAGVSGTGKTMAAEVLARELDLDVYRIDLSAVVSKYIGETEKNLRRVFDAAEGGGAILLFDEADALFGKRSEVRDSHDRYANIEVSYLLQRIESFDGLAILTSNMKSALDSAFLRRIRFIVQFSFPDAAQRKEIWRHVFPAGTPTEGLDYSRLARLNIAGGNIRNIALNAAFLAAAAGDAVHMGHLLRATRSEYTKLERPLNNSEILGWI